MESAAADAPAVTDNAPASRYEIRVGAEIAGFAEYKLRQHDTVISLLHTQVGDDFQGKGLAGQLARHVLDDARKRGRAVLPFCPYVNSWIKKHPEYAELVPRDRRAEFGL